MSFFSSNLNGAKVLVVRLDLIGDFIIWLDSARKLVDHYQINGYYVVLLGNKAWSNWAKEMGLADEVWGIDARRFRNSLLYRWRWLIRIRKAGFKITIQPTYSRWIAEGDSLVRASNSVERIGSAGDKTMGARFTSLSNRWYTRLIPTAPMQMMELRRNEEFMRGLGFVDYKVRLATIPKVTYVLPNLLLQQPFVVFVPSASWNGKAWPIDNFVRIGQLLIAVGFRIVVVGASSDRPHVSTLLEVLSEHAVDLVGKTNLGELSEVLRCASVVLTNDTGALHISAAVDVPVVCILGGGHFGRFVPYDIELQNGNQNLPIIVAEPMPCYGCNWECQFARKNGEAVKCIQNISVERVWDTLKIVLTKRKEKIVGVKDE